MERSIHFLLIHVEGRVRLHDLQREHMAPLWKDDKSVEAVMLWAVFCWETLSPARHVGVTLIHTPYLSIGQHLHLLRKLKRANLPPPILKTFYIRTIQGLLSSGVTVWYGNYKNLTVTHYSG